MSKKEDRLTVFNKFNGRCAYCGCEISFDSFEVDHVEALRRNDDYGGSDTIDNMLPACRPCNRSKSTFSPDEWKEQIYHKITMLNRDSSTYRMAKRFGLVEETNKPIVFWYEQAIGKTTDKTSLT